MQGKGRCGAADYLPLEVLELVEEGGVLRLRRLACASCEISCLLCPPCPGIAPPAPRRGSSGWGR
eukprot:1905840-Rhodomonas_salina.1